MQIIALETPTGDVTSSFLMTSLSSYDDNFSLEENKLLRIIRQNTNFDVAEPEELFRRSRDDNLLHYIILVIYGWFLEAFFQRQDLVIFDAFHYHNYISKHPIAGLDTYKIDQHRKEYFPGNIRFFCFVCLDDRLAKYVLYVVDRQSLPVVFVADPSDNSTTLLPGIDEYLHLMFLQQPQFTLSIITTETCNREDSDPGPFSTRSGPFVFIYPACFGT